jgi:phage baseplate assembly protein W
MPQIADIIYSDFNVVFAPHPETGALARVTNANSVKQAFRNLILTNYYGRFRQPFLASNIRAYLFENPDSITAAHIRDEVIRLAAYDTRVNLIECTVTPELADAGYNIVITFSVVTQTEPIVIKEFLERLR